MLRRESKKPHATWESLQDVFTKHLKNKRLTQIKSLRAKKNSGCKTTEKPTRICSRGRQGTAEVKLTHFIWKNTQKPPSLSNQLTFIIFFPFWIIQNNVWMTLLVVCHAARRTLLFHARQLRGVDLAAFWPCQTPGGCLTRKLWQYKYWCVTTEQCTHTHTGLYIQEFMPSLLQSLCYGFRAQLQILAFNDLWNVDGKMFLMKKRTNLDIILIIHHLS